MNAYDKHNDAENQKGIGYVSHTNDRMVIQHAIYSVQPLVQGRGAAQDNECKQEIQFLHPVE